MPVNLTRLNRKISSIKKEQDHIMKYVEGVLRDESNHLNSNMVISVGSVSAPVYKSSSSFARHQHDISFDGLDQSYRLSEALAYMLAAEYELRGKSYGGRRLFYHYNIDDIEKAPSSRKILGIDGYSILERGHGGYGQPVDSKGRKLFHYDKIDPDIYKAVLNRVHGSLYQSTNRTLFNKFDSLDLNPNSLSDFKKVYKVSRELVHDIKQSKAWAKKVDYLIKTAKVRQKQNNKFIAKASKSPKTTKPKNLLSMNELITIGKAILGRSTELCPIHTGFLRSSGRLYIGVNDIRIIYEAPYATYVHDNPNLTHAVGEDHFLAKAAQEVLKDTAIWVEHLTASVAGSYMAQTWDHDKTGRITSPMYWLEQHSYNTVFIDIDRNLNVNYAHFN